MSRITLHTDAPSSTTPDSAVTVAPAVLEAYLADGRCATETVEHARGSPQRPPTRQEFEGKFRQCARGVLSPEQTLLALRYLYQLDTLEDLRLLLDALSLAPQTE